MSDIITVEFVVREDKATTPDAQNEVSKAKAIGTGETISPSSARERAKEVQAYSKIVGNVKNVGMGIALSTINANTSQIELNTGSVIEQKKAQQKVAMFNTGINITASAFISPTLALANIGATLINSAVQDKIRQSQLNRQEEIRQQTNNYYKDLYQLNATSGSRYDGGFR